jgi:hypothetical protein
MYRTLQTGNQKTIQRLTRVVDAQNLEIQTLKASLADMQDDYRATMSEPHTGDDRAHCSCVPYLRRRIAELEAELKQKSSKGEEHDC